MGLGLGLDNWTQSQVREAFKKKPKKFWQMSKLDLQSAGSSPNLTYTKLGARDAIMIPWRGWIWTPPLDSDLDTSHKFPKVLGLRVEELGTPHWHLMVLGYSPSKTEGWFITFFLNLKYYPMSLLLLSTRSIILAGWIKRIILGTRLFSF